MSALAMTREPLSPHRHLDHVISMMDAALENGVLKFELKAAGGPDSALCREGAAEHGAAIRQFSPFEAPRDQFRNRQHGIQRALLVQLALAADPRKRTQDHLVPVTDDVFELPQYGRHHLVAHLLRHGDAVGLDLAVGVIGAQADEDASLPADQHEFDLAAGIAAANLDRI